MEAQLEVVVIANMEGNVASKQRGKWNIAEVSIRKYRILRTRNHGKHACICTWHWNTPRVG
jgi:hypothetical protein